MKTSWRALSFFKADAPRITVVLLLLVLGIVANLLKPWPLAILVDSVLEAKKPVPDWLGTTDKAHLLLLLAGLTLLLHAAQGVISAAQNYLAIGIGLRGLMRVRNQVFSCLQRLSLRFHQGSKSGDIIYRAAWDTYSFQTLFQQGMITSVTAFLSLVLMVVVMLRVNMALTLVALAVVPLLVLAIRVFGKQMTERGADAQQADSHVTSLVQQNIAALPLIQSYTREDLEEQVFTEQTATAQKKRLSQHGWELLYWLSISAVFAVGTAAIVWLGGNQVLAGKLTVGQLFIFLTYLAQLYEPLNQLSHVGATVSTATAGARRVFEILDTEEEVKDAPNARPIVRSPGTAATGQTGGTPPPLIIQGAISFEGVTFQYQKERDILGAITFNLAPGESAAIIGPSGVGKTTLLNLLPRFYDPTQGSIRLDGVDLREVRLKDLRANIAVVLQEPILLPATIAENIAYGKPGATREEIEAAARSANADVFIQKLPKKYDTHVGDGAARLSVGERQRLNLARAFLKDAPILLLDEPTSALDAESEALVVATIKKLMQGRTTLMVAHRLSTIRGMNKIIVLEEGWLTEVGGHAELIGKQGYYTRVVSGQVTLD